ncbi:MAG TPA: hypothetical protein VLA04_02600 [Verrucomicrobiae bacterium]|nr:hypothetical protein [Verrucomicrobiae bacterium]
MIELGKKNEIFGADELQPLRGFHGRPTTLPTVPKDHKVICGFNQGLGERIIVCESLEDMQHLYDSYAQGYALSIHWYSGEDPGFVMVIGGTQAAN